MLLVIKNLEMFNSCGFISTATRIEEGRIWEGQQDKWAIIYLVIFLEFDKPHN